MSELPGSDRQTLASTSNRALTPSVEPDAVDGGVGGLAAVVAAREAKLAGLRAQGIDPYPRAASVRIRPPRRSRRSRPASGQARPPARRG